ncbi:MAG: glycosyltransferase family 4 protein [Ruminococcaceae bacterium]|nr:glycosyltransferase family 4 protein [Oscillospiraceae bacterium]
MEYIFEFLFGTIEDILDSSFASGNSKKKLKIIRITALIGFPLFALLLIIGITEKNPDLILSSVVLLTALMIWLGLKVRKYRKHK